MTLDELEQQKQNILIKLNNVFDNPQKEAELKAQLDAVEKQIETGLLRYGYGRLCK